MNKNKPKEIKIKDLFKKSFYSIPIYQRNYAWTETEIRQLIVDVLSIENNTRYYIGSLVVKNRGDNKYEVIDGQQRLTTLYLILRYLNISISKKALKFDHRKKANKTLELSDFYPENTDNYDIDIIRGYENINAIFNDLKLDNKKLDEFKNKLLENVSIIRIVVDLEGKDLNHYFEIMNTRGEQLENHEIVKGRLFKYFENDSQGKHVVSIIWEACSNMDGYVQQNFNSIFRKLLFNSDQTGLSPSINKFDDLKKLVEKNQSGYKNTISFEEALKCSDEVINETRDVDNTKYYSIISFSNLLMQAKKSFDNNNNDEDEFSNENRLNQDKMLDIFFGEDEKTKIDTKETAKEFLMYLLKYRLVFDTYIVKRVRDTNEWSLKYHCAYGIKKSFNPVNTFKNNSIHSKDFSTKTKHIPYENDLVIHLEACMRTTFVSPKSMNWISLLMSMLMEKYDNSEEIKATDVIEFLEKYCCVKLGESDYNNCSGFGFNRIVFTFLDYLLYRENHEFYKHWILQLRNSVEHFHPQTDKGNDNWDTSVLNGLGNLALITVSANSANSNHSVIDKINMTDNYGNKVINQSPKLMLMADMVNKNDKIWTINMAEEHGKKMLELLDKETARYKETK